MKIIFKKLPLDDPRKRKPNIDLMKSLNWLPKVSLEDGLKETIEWFYENDEVIRK
mgnify:CR=1 FL=1